jgi:predicted amidohydrolase
MTKSIIAATCCYEIWPVTSVQAVLDKVSDLVTKAQERGVQLLVLPELFSTELAPLTQASFPESWREVARFSSTFDAHCAALATSANMYLVGGAHIQKAGDKYYNVTTLFHPDGLKSSYKKIHLFPIELEVGISPGSDLPLFDTPMGRIGIQVCFDIQFPETSRALALAGAEIICCPAYTFGEQGYLRVQKCCDARAIENDLYVLSSFTIGAEAQVPVVEKGFGRAAIVGPSDVDFAPGGVLATGVANSEQLVVAELDLELLHRYRQHGASAHLRARRDDLYKNCMLAKESATLAGDGDLI